jgi:hypothetical protein
MNEWMYDLVHLVMVMSGYLKTQHIKMSCYKITCSAQFQIIFSNLKILSSLVSVYQILEAGLYHRARTEAKS